MEEVYGREEREEPSEQAKDCWGGSSLLERSHMGRDQLTSETG